MVSALKTKSTGPKGLAFVAALLVVAGCAQGNANAQHNSEPPATAESHSPPPPNAIEPLVQTAPTQAPALPQLVAEEAREIDAVSLRLEPSTSAQLAQGESRFGDMFIADDAARSRLPADLRQELLNWLSIEGHFDNRIEKRCKPGRAIGLYVMMDGHKDMNVVIDRDCTAVRFFDANGSFVFSTYHDPSTELAARIIEKIAQ